MSAQAYGTPGPPVVFPDWSPYRDLEAACRAYLRDPEVALEALAGILRKDGVFGFTLERFVTEVNGVWQEVAVCDGDRLVLWHGEDVPPGDGPVGLSSSSLSSLSQPANRPRGGGAGLGGGAMNSSLRVVPLTSITEVGVRRRLVRTQTGQTRVESVDVYLLLGTLDEAAVSGQDTPSGTVRHDALRFGKTLEDGGLGQIARVEEFARIVASQLGRRAVP